MEAGHAPLLDTIRQIDKALISRSDAFDYDHRSAVSTASEKLKEMAYALGEYGSAAPGFTRLKDELQSAVEYLSDAVKYTRTDRIYTIANQITQLHSYFDKASKKESRSVQEELGALREQVKQYELQAKTKEVAKKKIDEVASVEASREWSSYYEKHIACEELPKSSNGRKAWFSRLRYWGDNFYLLERKWMQWRSIWFGSLMLLSGVLLILSLLQIWLGVGPLHVALEKLLAVPLYVVLGIGFAFASRNFRINANLLADYRHKQIVAKVLENVVLSNALEEKDGLKVDLLQQGAKSLFVAKNVGHLDKEAVEEFPIIELIKAIKK